MCKKRKTLLFRGSGVSLSQPPWCPSNVDCQEFMKEKVSKRIREYVKSVQDTTSPLIFSEQFVLETIMKDFKSDDKEYRDEFIRVFRMVYRQTLPLLELAVREGKLPDHYIK